MVWLGSLKLWGGLRLWGGFFLANKIIWGKLNDFQAYIYKLNKKVNKNKIIKHEKKSLKVKINFWSLKVRIYFLYIYIFPLEMAN